MKTNLLLELDGKTGGLKVWAEKQNLQELTKVYNYLKTHGISTIDGLAGKLESLTNEFNTSGASIKKLEADVEKTKVLKAHIINYAKTVQTYKAYSSSRHKEKFYDEHKGDILLREASRQAFKSMGVRSLPKVAELNADLQTSFTKPASDTEETRINNAINMIKSAISGCDNLSNLSIEVFAQGSYANNTNVKTDSDIDICVMLTSTVFLGLKDGVSKEVYGYTSGDMEFSTYKQYVIDALKNKFGTVTIGNKSIEIDSNSYRVQADAVPSFQYRNYKYDNSKDHNNYYEGINKQEYRRSW